MYREWLEKEVGSIAKKGTNFQAPLCRQISNSTDGEEDEFLELMGKQMEAENLELEENDAPSTSSEDILVNCFCIIVINLNIGRCSSAGV
jgi:hypothetical protein